MKKIVQTIKKELLFELLIVGGIFLGLGTLLIIGIKVNTLVLVLFGAVLFICLVPLYDRYRYIRYCLELLKSVHKKNPEKFFRNHLLNQHIMFRNTDHNVVSQNTTSAKVREIGLIEKINKVLDQSVLHIDYDEKDPFFEYYKNKTTS